MFTKQIFSFEASPLFVQPLIKTTIANFGTPSSFVNAGWPWYNFRSSCIVRFVQGGVVKTFRCGTLAVVARTLSAAMKQTYFRVISDSGASSADDLRGVVADLIATILGTSEYATMKPHDKGGYCLFLEYPDDSVQSVIDHLTANDWRPCF